MAGDFLERHFALLDAAGRIGLAEEQSLARLVRIDIEHEGAGFALPPLAPGHGPAGQHSGERRHVGLGVASTDTERVQFENLAREIFVEAALAVLAGPGIGPIDC